MLKYLLHKILRSVLHSKYSKYRRSSSAHKLHYGHRHSSDHRSSYRHSQQGHGYYKNKHRSSS